MGNMQEIAALATVSGNSASVLMFVSVERAKAWLGRSIWNRQRQHREYHSNRLAEIISRGEFMEGSQIHFAKLGEEIYCIDGQHTINAIVKANCGVTLSVLTTTVNSDAEIASLFAKHGHDLPRTGADMYRAFDVAGRFGLNDSQQNRLEQAIRQISCNFNKVRSRSGSYDTYSMEAQMRLVDTYAPGAKDFFEVIKGASSPVATILRRAAVCGVALVTFERNAAKAREFWSQLAFSDALPVGDPRRACVTWFLTHDLKKHPAPMQARIVAAAWNLFLAGGNVSRLRVADWTAPIVIGSA